MIEKMICAVIIAALWLCTYGALSRVVDAAEEALTRYKERIEQEWE